jgi:hypothetical protein
MELLQKSLSTFSQLVAGDFGIDNRQLSETRKQLAIQLAPDWLRFYLTVTMQTRAFAQPQAE